MSAFVHNHYGTMPVAQAREEARVAFLRQVGIKTAGSLLITAVAAVAMMAMILNGPAALRRELT